MSESSNKSSNREKSANKPKTNRNKDHRLVKRPPVKEEEGENIIYVNSNSNIKALVTKCNKLIHQETREIVIYCLGAAIKRGILLALQVTEQHKLYEISANTFTTLLTDDLEPATDEADYEVQNRSNSALKINLIRKN